MSASALLLYTTTLIVAVASPGPAVAAIIGFVLSRGIGGAFAFIAGIIFGEFFWLAAALFGVEAIAAKFPLLLLVLRFFGVGFLLYTAFGMWKMAGQPLSNLAIKGDTHVKLFLAGLALSASNPKVMVFYLSLLPSLIAGQSLGFTGYIVYSLIMLIVTSSVFTGYALLARQARRFLDDKESLKRVQQANALLLAIVAILLLISSLTGVL